MLRGQLAYKGERGYSAYEIAVQNGYTGTEEEWANAFLSADYYYTKTEADTLLATKANITDVYTKGDVAVISGSIDNTEEQYSLVQISDIAYPTGFTFDNCVVISVSFERTLAGGARHRTTGSRFTMNSFISGGLPCDVGLHDDSISLAVRGIYLRTFEDGDQDHHEVFEYPINNCDYKIILMKIPTEEEGE